MRLKYDKNYWDNYYDSPYEESYQNSFNPKSFLEPWFQKFNEPPKSIADIGAGPGHILKDLQQHLPNTKIYGVECQLIPKERQVFENIIFDDFLKIYKDLEPVDLLYVTCSMYIPWAEQEEFLKACLGLAERAVVFANVYLTDRNFIPSDTLRQVVYKSRHQFIEAIERVGGWECIAMTPEFFVK